LETALNTTLHHIIMQPCPFPIAVIAERDSLCITTAWL